MKAKKKRWSDLSSKQQAAVLTLGAVQATLAVTAWTDLLRRPASEVRGSKCRWAGIIGINGVGPVWYFTRGVRR